MAASPKCTSWDWTLLTPHGAKTIIWSCPPAPGPFCQIWSFRGWHLPVILIFWMLTKCFERTSVAATPLWSHSDSPEAKMKTCFGASLLPAPPEKPSAFPLGCWAAVTKWHRMPSSLWSISLIPSPSLSESPPLVAFVWISSCAYICVLSYKYHRTRGKLYHLLCSLWKWWRKKQTNKQTWP